MNFKKTYKIGEVDYTLKEFMQFVQKNNNVSKRGKITKINGPFDGKINSIYHFETETEQDFILRARISKAFRYEGIIKEKLLFPFLEGKLTRNSPNLGDQIKQLTAKKEGSYLFKVDPIKLVRIQNLLYYNETKDDLPYIYAIYDYLPGESLYYPLEKDRNDRPFLINSPKYIDIFTEMGKLLGKLHQIEFDGFYSDIREIGQNINRKNWSDLFNEQLSKELKEARTHNAIQPIISEIENFFSNRESLIRNETKPVLFHNDFQSQNILIQEYEQEFELKGIIDFDNWRIGPPAQDFVKIQYWTMQGNERLNAAFFDGYCSIHKDVDPNELQNRIDIYKMLWFVLVYNFEMDKVLKNEINTEVDQRFPAAEKYLDEIKKILNKGD